MFGRLGSGLRHLLLGCNDIRRDGGIRAIPSALRPCPLFGTLLLNVTFCTANSTPPSTMLVLVV